ncbi:hypothetical protein FGO68_gene12377 [Halteria grandinella]|uniref:Uncharacterized protein n=1 Tax=Halteria grandinella TaxID=5974 RepID=A0A8J8P1B3_HALGN|nr:hypothetical protein FGO68_gene12377 [Halteria grandinella]
MPTSSHTPLLCMREMRYDISGLSHFKFMLGLSAQMFRSLVSQTHLLLRQADMSRLSLMSWNHSNHVPGAFFHSAFSTIEKWEPDASFLENSENPSTLGRGRKAPRIWISSPVISSSRLKPLMRQSWVCTWGVVSVGVILVSSQQKVVGDTCTIFLMSAREGSAGSCPAQRIL